MNDPAVFNDMLPGIPKDTKHTIILDKMNSYQVTHNYVHNIYGHNNVRATYKGLIDRNKEELRPFLLTRSYWAGSQQYAGTWTGDNCAEYEYLMTTNA